MKRFFFRQRVGYDNILFARKSGTNKKQRTCYTREVYCSVAQTFKEREE